FMGWCGAGFRSLPAATEVPRSSNPPSAFPSDYRIYLGGSAREHDHSRNDERSCPQPIQIDPSAPEESNPDPIVDQDGDNAADHHHGARVDAGYGERVDQRARSR